MKTAFERIMTIHVPAWSARFDEKSRDYRNETSGWEPHNFLGTKGQFADIWRKIGKLKKSLWDGEDLTGEQPIEIIDDLIAHLFLTRDMLVDQQEIPQPNSGTFGGKPRYLRALVGHGYDGCRICVEAREKDPGLIL